jgi:hypothetical protein
MIYVRVHGDSCPRNVPSVIACLRHLTFSLLSIIISHFLSVSVFSAVIVSVCVMLLIH